jgi:hypothetical protein
MGHMGRMGHDFPHLHYMRASMGVNGKTCPMCPTCPGMGRMGRIFPGWFRGTSNDR